jgi:hypothetical protein
MVYSVCILDSIKLGLDYILDNCPSNVNGKSERLQKDTMLVNKCHFLSVISCHVPVSSCTKLNLLPFDYYKVVPFGNLFYISIFIWCPFFFLTWTHLALMY